jgi:DNA-binding IclR family transcriptional regulator
MTSLTRMLAVLDLFTSDRPSWTADSIARELGYTQPTVYRYLRELQQSGLLRDEAASSFVLGPRVIELDYQMRTGDPLLVASQKPMRALMQSTGCDVALVGVCGSHVITLAYEPGPQGMRASYGRGRRMPVFRGAMSHSLLSALSRPQLRKLYASNLEEAQASELARDWDGLLCELRKLRQQGYTTSEGVLDPGNAGVAVPLTSSSHAVTAALGFVMPKENFSLVGIDRAVPALQHCRDEILKNLS